MILNYLRRSGKALGLAGLLSGFSLAHAEVAVDLPHSVVQLGNNGALVQSWTLKGYRMSGENKATPQVELESLIHGSGSIYFAFDRDDLGYLTQGSGKLEKTGEH